MFLEVHFCGRSELLLVKVLSAVTLGRVRLAKEGREMTLIAKGQVKPIQ